MQNNPSSPTTNTSLLVQIPVAVQVQTFILPRKQRADPLLKYLYAENYIDEPAKAKCRYCKARLVSRTCAEGEMGKGNNTCWVAFQFCPNCRRVKPDTPFQRKLMASVKNLKPLTKEYIFIQNKFLQAKLEGRFIFTKAEVDGWHKEFNAQKILAEGSCANG